jgi:hypothetical protein
MTPAGVFVRLRVSLGVPGLEWREAVQGESEVGDSVEQPVELRLVDVGPVMSVRPSCARIVIPSNADA